MTDNTVLPARDWCVDYDIALEVASHEAIIRQAYKDSEGVWTWSVGLTSATGHDVERYIGKPQPLAHCLAIYVWALDRYAEAVRKAFGATPLTKAQFAAALSFQWNTGSIGKASWVKHFKAGRAVEARKAFMSWSKPEAIIPRRQAERDLFFEGKWSNDGRITEYTKLTSKSTPVWSSGKRINIEKELRAAFAAAAPIPTPPVRPKSPTERLEPAPVPQVPAAPPASTSWASRILIALGLAPKPPALPVEQPRAGFSEVVQRAQLQLQALGYAEVGEADGLMGDRTKAAIRAFSADQKPPLATDGQLTDAMLAAIMKGARRPVAEARANATAKDLRQAGNEPAKALNGLGWLGNLIGLGGIAGAVNETGVLDSIKSAADTATGTIATIQGVVVGIVNAVQWMIAHWWLFAILAGVWMVYRVAKGVLELVVLFRQGVLTRKAIGVEQAP